MMWRILVGVLMLGFASACIPQAETVVEDPNWIDLEVVDTAWQISEDEYEIFVVAKNNTSNWLFQPVFSIDYGKHGTTHAIGLAEIVPPNGYIPYSARFTVEEFGAGWNGDFSVLEVEALKKEEGQEELTGAYPFLLVNTAFINPENSGELCWEIQNVGDEEYLPSASWGLDIHLMFFDAADQLIKATRTDAFRRSPIAAG